LSTAATMGIGGQRAAMLVNIVRRSVVERDDALLERDEARRACDAYEDSLSIAQELHDRIRDALGLKLGDHVVVRARGLVAERDELRRQRDELAHLKALRDSSARLPRSADDGPPMKAREWPLQRAAVDEIDGERATPRDIAKRICAQRSAWWSAELAELIEWAIEDDRKAAEANHGEERDVDVRSVRDGAPGASGGVSGDRGVAEHHGADRVLPAVPGRSGGGVRPEADGSRSNGERVSSPQVRFSGVPSGEQRVFGASAGSSSKANVVELNRGDAIEVKPTARGGVPYGCPPRGEVVGHDAAGLVHCMFRDAAGTQWPAWFRRDELLLDVVTERELGAAPLRFAKGDRVRVIGGAWVGCIGKLATVLATDAHVSTVKVDGESGTLSLATAHLDIAASTADVHARARAIVDAWWDLDVEPEEGREALVKAIAAEILSGVRSERQDAAPVGEGPTVSERCGARSGAGRPSSVAVDASPGADRRADRATSAGEIATPGSFCDVRFRVIGRVVGDEPADVRAQRIVDVWWAKVSDWKEPLPSTGLERERELLVKNVATELREIEIEGSEARLGWERERAELERVVRVREAEVDEARGRLRTATGLLTDVDTLADRIGAFLDAEVSR